MMSRNGSVTGGPAGRSMPTTIRPKKKPAPPRPPQPKINRLQTSQSFNTAQDLFPVHGDISSKPKPTGRDLIDFSTPPGSPSSGRRNTVSQISTALRDPNDFSYRVGASIFYIKSPLKNSISHKPVQNPFSPPRPSADSMNTNMNQQKPTTGVNSQSSGNAAWSTPSKPTNIATAWDTPPAKNPSTIRTATDSRATVSGPSSMVQGVVNSQLQTASSLENNNTIKSNYPTSSPWAPVGASSSSNASSDLTSNSFSDYGGNSQPRYGNVPSDHKKELTATLSSGSGAGSKPTIIRPANKIPSQGNTNGNTSSQTASAIAKELEHKLQLDSEVEAITQRNLYDVPPDEDDFDDEEEDELNDSSFMSPPMPSEPPPPPPPDVLAVDEWVSSTTGVTDYPDSDSGQVTAYAIALYDFAPESEGDLPLQAGDLVYLLRKVDDSWYHGSCGGMEGMFPSNFVNIMVPLPEETVEAVAEPPPVPGEYGGEYTEVLYDFPAETDGDLSLRVGEKVKVIGRINEDWLYGEKDGFGGQFPAAFVQPITQDLPIVKP